MNGGTISGGTLQSGESGSPLRGICVSKAGGSISSNIVTGQRVELNGPGVLSYTGSAWGNGLVIAGESTFDISGGGAIGGGVLQCYGGVLQSSGTFSRSVATSGNGNVYWAQGGGFAAKGGALTVSLAVSGTANAPLIWQNTGDPSAGGSQYLGTTGFLMFGSLSTGVQRQLPWQTLLFRPGPPSHPGSAGPKDHLLLDLFWMPVVEPYAISEPFSTAGKINMNQQLVPFTLVGDNTRERPCADLYERLTTKSNTFTVHYRAQALRQPKQNLETTPTVFDISAGDKIVAERRGATTFERYLDPNDKRFVAGSSDADSDATGFFENPGNNADFSLEPFYRVRILNNTLFHP